MANEGPARAVVAAAPPGPGSPPARGRGRRVVLVTLLVLAAVASLVAYAQQQKLRRLWFVMTLFSEREHVAAFREMDRYFPVHWLRRGGSTWEFARRPGSLPETYPWQGETRRVAQFLEDTDTTGLVVVQDDAIVFEDYWRGNTAETRWISWSVGKSFVSALMGIAIAEGHITGVAEPVTRYVPELRGSGYDGVRIKDVLQMSSGVAWNEDYSSPGSDINRFGRTWALGKPFDAFVGTLRRERAPGTFNRYVSMDTQVLGMVLTRATGKTLSAYLEARIWQRIGAEADAYWITDDAGMEFAAGGLNVTTRDYARFGRLYLNGGNWNGEQIVPAPWVHDSVTPDGSHLMPGDNPLSDYPMGYGYQWWIPTDPDGEFAAIGVFNQFIYLYPRERLIIVKTSANSSYGTTRDESSYRELEHIEVFRAIAAHLRAAETAPRLSH